MCTKGGPGPGWECARDLFPWGFRIGSGSRRSSPHGKSRSHSGLHGEGVDWLL